MSTDRTSDILRDVDERRAARSHMAEFMGWLDREGLAGATSYGELWRWSVDDTARFWAAFAAWSGLELPTDPGLVRHGSRMPHVRWWPDARLNYAELALGRRGPGPALVCCDEVGRKEVDGDQLADLVRRCRAGLRARGVGEGDAVAAYLPNRLEAAAAFLATASLGAVWTICSPDFGASSVVERFRQIEPTVLLACDGYRYGGRWHDRSAELADLRAGLPSLRCVVAVGEPRAGCDHWDDLTAPTTEHLDFAPVPFDHPLWAVYTSGTTGVPKSIVHGHGGIVVEHCKLLRLHLDLGPGDRLMWFTTTGWVMWNIVLGSLLVGATPVLYDGSPLHPDRGALWRVAADTATTFFGTSAGFIHDAVRHGGLRDASGVPPHLHSLGVTGSPLSPEGAAWVTGTFGPGVALDSISGGTDVASALLGSCPLLPLRAGRLQGACLGVDAHAFDESARSVVGSVGELVVAQALPSMPLRFVGDAGGARLHASYFDTYPGLWRHGDWVEVDDDGSWIIYGRSDATLNRGGVRMGTSDFYSVLDALPELTDCLVIDTSAIGSPAEELVVLAVKADGAGPDGDISERIGVALRQRLSPRHVPDTIIYLPALPHTLNGKRIEVPARKLFVGLGTGPWVDPNAIDDRSALDALVGAAEAWRAERRSPPDRARRDASAAR